MNALGIIGQVSSFGVRSRKGVIAGGFTLIELLTVMAIIGLLTASLLPATASVRTSAKRAKTKVQFGQWVVAMEQFRQEYGYYPAIDAGHPGKVDSAFFAGALTGTALDGSAVAAPAQLAGNVKRMLFYRLSDGELNETRSALIDAFGNTDIAVLYDKNGDGWITNSDGTAPAVAGIERAGPWTPDRRDLDLVAGIRAGVLFYSAGRGAGSDDFIFSWK